MADVNKHQRSGFIRLGKVILLFPDFSQTKKIELMVRKEILDKMTLVRKQADFEHTEVDSKVVALDSCISRPSWTS